MEGRVGRTRGLWGGEAIEEKRDGGVRGEQKAIVQLPYLSSCIGCSSVIPNVNKKFPHAPQASPQFHPSFTSALQLDSWEFRFCKRSYSLFFGSIFATSPSYSHLAQILQDDILVE